MSECSQRSFSSDSKFSFNNIHLNFIDISLEKKFRANKIGAHKLSLQSMCLMIIIISNAVFFSNSFPIDLLQAHFLFLHFFSVVSVFLMGLIFTKKFPEKCEMVIVILPITYIVAVTELSRIVFNEREWNPVMYTMLMTVIQFFSLYIIQSRIRWIYFLFEWVFLQIYIMTRNQISFDHGFTKQPIIISLLFSAIIMPYFIYAREKEDRRIFVSIEKLQSYQKGFEEFLKNVIPSSIIMIQEENINFFNKKCQEMFLVDNQEELLDKLHLIQVRTDKRKKNS